MNNKQSPTSKSKAKRHRKDKEEGEARSKKFRGADEEDIEENKNHIEAEPVASEVTWTNEETKLLISRIEGLLPKTDTRSFHYRLTHLNWEDVKFEPFSSEQCRTHFLSILIKLRKFRTLTEILEDAVKWVDEPKKKIAHPEKPSKPMTSYFIFYTEKRLKLSKKYPDLKLTELAQKLSDKYKSLPPEKKQKYIEKAEALKEEYMEKMRIFYEHHPDQIPVDASTKKPNAAGLLKPQAPMKNYCDKKIKDHKHEANFDQKELLAKYKNKWHKMSDKKKFVWIKWTVEKETEYMEKMKIFQAKNPELCTLNDFKSVLTKEEKSLYDKMCGKPEKPPSSAYLLFCRDHLKSCNGASQREKLKECSDKWKSMTNNQKSEYSDRVKHMQEKYEHEYSSYLSKLPEPKRRAELEVEKAKIKTKAAKTNHKAETMCNALENFIQRSNIPTTSKIRNEPVEPPKTTKEYFIQKYMNENGGPGESVTITQAKSAWKALSDKKKFKYTKELTELKGIYIRDYEAFLKLFRDGMSLHQTLVYIPYSDEVTYHHETAVTQHIYSLGEKELKEYSSLHKIRKENKTNEESGDSDDDDDDDGEEEEDDSNTEEKDAENKKESENEQNDDSDSDSSSD